MTNVERLHEANTAYHALMIGQSLVEVTDQNGERVRFTAAKRADLYAYIQELNALVTPPTACPPSNGPLSFLF